MKTQKNLLLILAVGIAIIISCSPKITKVASSNEPVFIFDDSQKITTIIKNIDSLNLTPSNNLSKIDLNLDFHDVNPIDSVFLIDSVSILWHSHR